MPNQGINLSWTAAEDSSSQSTYEIYYLANGQYILYAVATPKPVRVAGSPATTLTPPATTFTFPWSIMVTLETNGNTLAAITMAVQHVTYSGLESDLVATTVYPPSVGQPNAPHMRGGFALDAYGQVVVAEENSQDEIYDCVSMILGTTAGQRSLVPSFGIPDITFTNANPADIESIVAEWEKRAKVQISISYNDSNQAVISASIQTNGAQ